MPRSSFSNWTEVDPNSKISTSAIAPSTIHNRATWTNMIRNEECYLYRNYGSVHAFLDQFTFIVTAIDVAVSGGSFYGYVWALTNFLGKLAGANGNKWYSCGLTGDGSDTNFKVRIDSSLGTSDSSSLLDVNTLYYVTIYNTSSGAGVLDRLKCIIYSDEGRTTIVDTLTATISAGNIIAMQYRNTCMSQGSATQGTGQSDGYVQDLVVNGGDYDLGGGGGGMGGSLGIPGVTATVGGSGITAADVLDIHIHLGVTEEVSSYTMVLDNDANKYGSGGSKIDLYDTIALGIGWGGSTPTIITGRVESIELIDRVEEYEYSNVARISGRCKGWQLFAKKYSGDLISDAGSGEAGVIVKYLIDNYTSLSHDRSGELIETTNTTYIVLEYDESTSIWDILKFICETASDTDGNIGYEMRIEYDGKFAFFSKNDKVEYYTLFEEVQIENYQQTIERVKNKITIKGRADKPFPAGSDGVPGNDTWTDLSTPEVSTTVDGDSNSGQKVLNVAATTAFVSGSKVIVNPFGARQEELVVDTVQAGVSITMTTNLVYTHTAVQADIVWKHNTWLAIRGASGGIVGEGTIKQAGSYSVKVTSGGGPPDGVGIYTNTPVDCTAYPEFHVLLRVAADSLFMLQLMDSSKKYASVSLGVVKVSATFPQFKEVKIRTDEDYADAWNVDSGFDWSDIIVVEVIKEEGGGVWYLDYMYFVGKRWGGGTSNSAVDGFAEDSTSQTSYGTREYFEVNEGLLSDGECESRAQALLDLYKDPLTIIKASSETVDWGNDAPHSGNRIYIDMTPLSLNGYYRIDEMDIHIEMKSKTLSVNYTLSSKPTRLADYLYRQQRKIKELSLARSSKKRKR